MSHLETHEVEERLVQEFGYQPTGARVAASRLTELSGAVGEAFRMWWTKGIAPTIEVEGFTPERLHAEHNMNVIAALLTLDWLSRDPAAAKASLRKGHDWASRVSPRT